ncbi:hypothetical protein [Halocatena pleomorpha]|uniref:Uncharacterized protein n=1 Tax=Halocatena pleomorpha TaxID=1785090 RepID=A0A3P3RCG1_9EURY|nr:hypothetical protein [Halocatena pleomorpha]RRJ31004.1 hypothetical protein EIK79_08310 [Halocatena pleomorpha]
MDGSNEQTNADANERRDSDSTLSRTVLSAGSIAVIGIITTGVMVYVLDRIGPAGSADIMWIIGYGVTIFVLWHLLVRPIDFSQRY